MALASLCWLAGCGPSLHIEGTWIGHRNVESVPGADPAIVAGMSKVELRVDDKGHFVLFENGIPKTGSLSSSGDTGTLNILEVAGRRGTVAAKTVVKDGAELVYTDPDVPGERVILKPKG